MIAFELNFISISDRKFALCNQEKKGVKIHLIIRVRTLFNCKVLRVLIVFISSTTLLETARKLGLIEMPRSKECLRIPLQSY
jgi:hypothetical protein